MLKTYREFNKKTYILNELRNDETIISSISVTDIVFDVYLGKWNYRAIPKVKTWSYFLTIPKLWSRQGIDRVGKSLNTVKIKIWLK